MTPKSQMKNTQKKNCEGLGQGQRSFGKFLVYDTLIGNEAALGSRFGNVGVSEAHRRTWVAVTACVP